MSRAWCPLEKEGACAVSLNLSVGSYKYFFYHSVYWSFQCYFFIFQMSFMEKNIHGVFDEK